MTTNSQPYSIPAAEADHDASWDTLPMSGNRRQPTPSSFPKTILNGLAGLLVVSLCILLVELNNPGTASMVAGKVFGNQKSESQVGIIKSQMGGAVPAPFVVVAPQAKRMGGTGLNEPTSEPTVFLGRMSFSGPTNEPTVFLPADKNNLMAAQLSGPTSEPTIFPSVLFVPTVGTVPPTAEPTTFSGPGGPTSEPTTFQGPLFPTSEPTTFNAPVQAPAETFTPTSDPTTFPTANPTIFPTPSEKS